MGGGAWPFLVGGVICLVNSVNERDLCVGVSDYIARYVRMHLLDVITLHLRQWKIIPWKLKAITGL